MSGIDIQRIRRPTAARLDDLAALLVDCVDGDASVGFMGPLTRQRARAWWQGVADDADKGDRVLLVAEDAAGRIVGSVQLVLAQPENQPHRADLAKLLVRRSHRRQGIAEALMRAAEAEARRCGKTLLVLDTASDSADRLYRRLGWQCVGTIPGYALWPRGGACDTVIFYRELPA
jgi:ribosomal protein S18 acetylase RimI-like enzyme